MRRWRQACVVMALLAGGRPAGAAFDLSFQIPNPGGQFTATEIQLLTTAYQQAETMWETAIIGYAPGVNIGSVAITINPTTEGLAFATTAPPTTQGGFTYSTGGSITVNVNEIENFASWQGPGANGLNFLDEVLAHETGHVLGVGTLWTANQAYVAGSFQYTGQFGLAAYRAEFDATATFVPVENAGGLGTAGAHWDQRMRSSAEEGNPSDPWSLDPRVGVVDRYGRDRALEVMTGGVDPDWGQPYLSRLTVESMRDLGYTVAAFEDFNGDGFVSGADLAVWRANFGSTGLAIDSIARGDADRNRSVAGRDFLLWQQRFAGGGPGGMAVPEPAAAALGAIPCGFLTAARRWQRRQWRRVKRDTKIGLVWICAPLTAIHARR